MNKLSIKWQKLIIWVVGFLGFFTINVNTMAGIFALIGLGVFTGYVLSKCEGEIVDTIKAVLIYGLPFILLAVIGIIINGFGAYTVYNGVICLIVLITFAILCALDMLGLDFVVKFTSILGLDKVKEAKVEETPVEESVQEEPAEAVAPVEEKVEEPAPVVEEPKAEAEPEPVVEEPAEKSDEERMQEIYQQILRERAEKAKQEKAPAKKTTKKSSK